MMGAASSLFFVVRRDLLVYRSYKVHERKRNTTSFITAGELRKKKKKKKYTHLLVLGGEQVKYK
jgi:hypothetical protein